MAHVELNLVDGGRGSITVDGIDWSNAVQGVRFSSKVGDTNLMTVYLSAPSVSGKWDTTVALPIEVEEVLIQLGWTPPKELGVPTAG